MDALSLIPLTLQTGKPGLAAGTTTSYTIGATFPYAINGKAYSKASASNQATPTTDIVTGAAFVPVPANAGSVFVFMVDSSGNVKVAQGQVQALDASGAFVTAPQFPVVPDGYCAFGYLVVKAGSTASAWTLGSSNLSGATGLTYAFQDVMTLPARPQIS